MKVVFLDIDGVLNNRRRFKPEKGTYVLCPIACGRFVEMVERVGAKVVLSSTWRKHEDHVDLLRWAGVLDEAHEDWRTKSLTHADLEDGATHYTPPNPYGSVWRGEEIKEWLSRHPEVTEYAIVDDDGDMLPEQMSHFVHTNTHIGLLPEHVAKIEAILTP